MLCAISLADGTIPARFADTTDIVLCQTAKDQPERRIVRHTGETSVSELIRVLLDDGADVLIAGSVGREAQERIADAGILLYPNAEGTADEALEALAAHKLRQAPVTPPAD
ncbi:MAG: NifB/NifX family molybdenum-iron cluster-binding protein [Atopobiaceae bacterium]